jgi:hypothetical protein
MSLLLRRFAPERSRHAGRKKRNLKTAKTLAAKAPLFKSLKVAADGSVSPTTRAATHKDSYSKSN